MARLRTLFLLALAAAAPAGPAAASSGWPDADSITVRSLASPALQSFT